MCMATQPAPVAAAYAAGGRKALQRLSKGSQGAAALLTQMR